MKHINAAYNMCKYVFYSVTLPSKLRVGLMMLFTFLFVTHPYLLVSAQCLGGR